MCRLACTQAKQQGTREIFSKKKGLLKGAVNKIEMIRFQKGKKWLHKHLHLFVLAHMQFKTASSGCEIQHFVSQIPKLPKSYLKVLLKQETTQN